MRALRRTGNVAAAALAAGVDKSSAYLRRKADAGFAARAEPIAARFEAGQAWFAGRFPELEDQLCGMTAGGYRGPGASPDRADAMVWAMTELFRPKAVPRVRQL